MNNKVLDNIFGKRNERFNRNKEYEDLMNTNKDISGVCKNLKEMVMKKNNTIDVKDIELLKNIIDDEYEIYENDIFLMKQKLKIEYRYIELLSRILITS